MEMKRSVRTFVCWVCGQTSAEFLRTRFYCLFLLRVRYRIFEEKEGYRDSGMDSDCTISMIIPLAMKFRLFEELFEHRMSYNARNFSGTPDIFCIFGVNIVHVVELNGILFRASSTIRVVTRIKSLSF